MKKNHFKCTYCHEIFNEEEESKEREPGTRHAMCWDCFNRNYMIDCPLCEDYFRDNSKPGKYYFVLMPADVEQTAMKSGIYRANSFPVWTSDMFTVTINQHNVELITELDDKVLNKDCHTNEICSDCFKKYTNENWLKHKKQQILINAVINEIRNGAIGNVITKHKGDLTYFGKAFKPIINSLNRRRDIQFTKMRKVEREIYLK